MKYLLALLFIPTIAKAQSLELHGDLRKSIAPKLNGSNFTSLYFEYWKGSDSGSTLVKVQADLLESRSNIGKAYLQVARGIRIYKTLQLHLSYSGGLGLTQPREYSYVINNVFAAGLSKQIHWGDAILTAVADLRLSSSKQPGLDPLVTLYWWKPFRNYSIQFMGDFSAWTQTRTQITDRAWPFRKKNFAFFAEPQLWFSVYKKIHAGTRVNMFYHVLRSTDNFEVYPTIGLKTGL